ncbi:MAG: phosphoglycerate dehydrogenase [Planctomycetes bacterium]|nr:phosphoglycerate dehydrogenase [Planctomycetota bacterium]
MSSTVAPSPSTRTPVVLVADKLDPAGVEILKSAGVTVIVRPGLSPDELREAARDVDGILVRSAAKITAEIIDGAHKLRAIGRAGIGVDNIDVGFASQRGVLVMNTPLANATTTAELAIAHMFGMARHLQRAQASMRAGKWEKSAFVGREITGKTLAVIGLGKIGRIVADRALGLRMHVIAFDPFLTGASPVDGVELVTLDEALARADFVTVHVPKSKETAGLLGRAAFAKMKRGSYLVNCARGGVVVEDDLLAALADGTLAGAALDVFSSEPLAEDSPLRQVENLMLTPHLGASSAEAQERVSTEIAAQMVDYLQKGEARCAVNAPAVKAEDLAVLRPYMHLGRRSGLILAQVVDDPIVRVEIAFRGQLAARDTAPVRVSVVAGLLSPSLDAPVTEVNAEALATERGLKILEEHDKGTSEYTSLLEVSVTTRAGAKHTVAGTVFRARPRLVSFDGCGVDFEPEGALLLTRHDDAPGVLGQVATFLGTHGINIANLHMGAPKDGATAALALYELDERVPDADLLAQLAALPPMREARVVLL